jgi:hypothetical protein
MVNSNNSSFINVMLLAISINHFNEQHIKNNMKIIYEALKKQHVVPIVSTKELMKKLE